MALNDRQRLFVDEYLIDLNATRAAIRAGYSPKSATTDGPRLLENAGIRACIDKKLAERSRRTGVNADRVVLELARIAFADITRVAGSDGQIMPDAQEDDRAAIASIKVRKMADSSEEREARMYDKNRALELLGKHLGLYQDRVAVTGDLPRIIDDVANDTRQSGFKATERGEPGGG